MSKGNVIKVIQTISEYVFFGVTADQGQTKDRMQATLFFLWAQQTLPKKPYHIWIIQYKRTLTNWVL